MPSERCSECKKKLPITAYKCRCEHYFCSLHMPETAHKCAYDYRQISTILVAATGDKLRGGDRI